MSIGFFLFLKCKFTFTVNCNCSVFKQFKAHLVRTHSHTCDRFAAVLVYSGCFRYIGTRKHVQDRSTRFYDHGKPKSKLGLHFD